MSLRRSWEDEAGRWIRWAQTPGHDAFWRFSGPAFLGILPPPGLLTVDIGCGEGRLGRRLRELGHRVIGVDSSPTLARAASAHQDHLPAVLADAVRLPIRDGVADLAVAFMSLQDMDDFFSAVGEAARILRTGGRLCLAVVHPLNAVGDFEDDDRFVLRRPYLESWPYSELFERDGLTMTFHSAHHSVEKYSLALEEAGFLIEAIREPSPSDDAVAEDPRLARWRRVPMLLLARAVRAGGSGERRVRGGPSGQGSP